MTSSSKGLQILQNLAHRGACGCDSETGDGAGVLIQIPHKFFVKEAPLCGFTLPRRASTALVCAFCRSNASSGWCAKRCWKRSRAKKACRFWVGAIRRWKAMPSGAWRARLSPTFSRFSWRVRPGVSADEFERRLFVVRKRTESQVAQSDIRDKKLFLLPSFSSRTIVYKGLLLAHQIGEFYAELLDPDTVSAMCLVHQRFSTNTFPTWQLAHPFRYICHNGEINTVRGNTNWMNARQGVMTSPLFDDFKKLLPVIQPGVSDSAALDNAVELLTMTGRSLPHVMAMLMPEAWDGHSTMSDEKKAFYEYHASLMEPWDGPAAVAFTDGRMIGATLDRNGLRPARYLITHDGLLVMASGNGRAAFQAGRNSERRAACNPARCCWSIWKQGRLVPDKEIKNQLAARQPYREWLDENQITLESLPEPSRMQVSDHGTVVTRQRCFGYTDEDLRLLIGPMASDGQEAIGSMGIDTPLACLSDRPQSLFHYFKQLFAQVTNPPIDPIREELVMSLTSYIGVEGNILSEVPQNCHTLKLTNPILTNRELEKLRRVSRGDLLAHTLPTTFSAHRRRKGLQARARRVVPPRVACHQIGLHAADSFGPQHR